MKREIDAKFAEWKISQYRKALIVDIAKSTKGTGLPLNSNALSKIMKPIFFDLGLMQYACGINPFC